mmetsp:Transcript_43137/g.74441  ORF Transcript_43137/g.74441 Transcript_43137/m.74441 type:complete len:254 (+) Transcript_43137:144-905(+)
MISGEGEKEIFFMAPLAAEEALVNTTQLGSKNLRGNEKPDYIRSQSFSAGEDRVKDVMLGSVVTMMAIKEVRREVKEKGSSSTAVTLFKEKQKELFGSWRPLFRMCPVHEIQNLLEHLGVEEDVACVARRLMASMLESKKYNAPRAEGADSEIPQSRTVIESPQSSSNSEMALQKLQCYQGPKSINNMFDKLPLKKRRKYCHRVEHIIEHESEYIGSRIDKRASDPGSVKTSNEPAPKNNLQPEKNAGEDRLI